jgi:hexokinase
MTTTENKAPAVKTDNKEKLVDINKLSIEQIMSLLAKKETEKKQAIDKAVLDTVKRIESDKEIKAVLEGTDFVKLVVFMDENGKVKAQYMEKKVDTKQHVEDGRASKTIMTIHDNAGNLVLEIKNTRKPEKFFQYLKDNIPSFKDAALSHIQEEFKENSESYLKALQASDSNKFRIVK